MTRLRAHPGFRARCFLPPSPRWGEGARRAGEGAGIRGAGGGKQPGPRAGSGDSRPTAPPSKVDGSITHGQAACTDRRRRQTQRIRSGATAAADRRKTHVEGSGAATKSRVIGGGLF
jgi:hypothetical protein